MNGEIVKNNNIITHSAKPSEWSVIKNNMIRKISAILLVLFVGIISSGLKKTSVKDLEIYAPKNYSSKLTCEAKKKIKERIINVLKEEDSFNLLIRGYSNREESKDNDTILSQTRAENAKKFIISKGINEERIQCKAMGGSKLFDYSDDGDIARKNRRTRFTFYYK